MSDVSFLQGTKPEQTIIIKWDEVGKTSAQVSLADAAYVVDTEEVMSSTEVGTNYSSAAQSIKHDGGVSAEMSHDPVSKPKKGSHQGRRICFCIVGGRRHSCSA